MKPFIFQALACCLLVPVHFCMPSFAENAKGSFWNLPQTLSRENTEISFIVDSTWHEVHGQAGVVEGKVWLADPKDWRSVQVSLRIPVNSLETAGESRDKRLREVMAESSYPEIKVEVKKIAAVCDPSSFPLPQPCKAVGTALLTIRSVTREVELPLAIQKDPVAWSIEGEIPVQWADYQVEDPSILIARLDSTVTIHYRFMWPL